MDLKSNRMKLLLLVVLLGTPPLTLPLCPLNRLKSMFEALRFVCQDSAVRLQPKKEPAGRPAEKTAVKCGRTNEEPADC